MTGALSESECREIEEQVIAAARLAGKRILDYYGQDKAFSQKADGSPLTRADKASHESIMKSLSGFTFPVVSEEAPEPNASGEYYWLVDPLDGTKDFLANNDEFTVNIALIRNNRPIMGAVYAPALDELYVGAAGGPVWREKYGIRVLCPKIQRSNGLSMATSRFHDHPGTIRFAEVNRVLTSVPIGAALKYGRLAMGEIDVYPRLVGTSEWDTAAGQIILEAAGGALVDWESGKPMEYGKPNRRNGRFLAFRRPYREMDFIRVWR